MSASAPQAPAIKQDRSDRSIARKLRAVSGLADRTDRKRAPPQPPRTGLSPDRSCCVAHCTARSVTRTRTPQHPAWCLIRHTGDLALCVTPSSRAHGSIITKFCTHRVDVTIKYLREAAQRTVSTMRSGAPHGASPSGRIGELLSAVHARALDLELRWDHDSHRSAETCGTPNLAGLSTGLVYGIFSPP